MQQSPLSIPHDKKNLKDRLKEAGNVLFMILIAVALFAALSYVVTQSTRSTGGDASREQVKLATAGTMQIFANMDSGLQRFLISNGYSIEQIDMFKTGETAYGYLGNATSCTVDACNLHSPNGGNVTVPILPNTVLSKNTTSACNTIVI